MKDNYLQNAETRRRFTDLHDKDFGQINYVNYAF